MKDTAAKSGQRFQAFDDAELELLRAAVEYHQPRRDLANTQIAIGDEIAREIQRRRIDANMASGRV